MNDIGYDLSVQPSKATLKHSKTTNLKHSIFKKNKQKVDALKHEYFSSHQCCLPPEKLMNAHQIKCGRLRKWLLNLTSVHMGDIRSANLYRSYAALCAEKYRQYKHYPLSIHPFCKLRLGLEVIVIITTMLSSVILAVDITSPANRIHNTFIHSILAICESIYILNIILNFFTGYVEGNTYQYVVLDLKKIFCHYLKTSLILDLVSTLSVIPTVTTSEQFGIFGYLLLDSTRVLRILIQLKYLKNIMIASRVGVFGKTISEIILLVMNYLVWNIYFQFSRELINEGSYNPKNPDNCSWITRAKLWDAEEGLRFTYALDRAVGMLRKHTHMNLVEQERCFEFYFIVSWIIAKLLLYHCIYKYIVFLFGKESAKAKYFIMTKQVGILMSQRKFPPRIKAKILKFYAIRYQAHYSAETKMLNCVTGQLREDIIMHTGRQLVRELEFLKQLPRALLLHIGLKLKIVIFIAGDIIFKINTVGDCLYFIDKGTVAIYSASGNEICHLEDGDYFGEIALVMKHSIRTASAVAVTNCELFRLDKEDFHSSIACYPTVYENIKKVAINRYERTCVLDEHHKAELKMAEDHLLKEIINNMDRDKLDSDDRQ